MNCLKWGLLLCGGLVGYAKPPRHRLVLTPKDTAVPVAVRRNTLLEIQLPAHFGRGYSWLKKDSCVQLTTGQGSHAKLARSELPTSITTSPNADCQIFMVLTKKRGTCRLSFAYRQPFDIHAPAQDSLTFTLHIQ